MSTATATAPVLTDFHPRTDTFRSDFIAGMSRPQKQLSPKYLYDARGSRLFDQICELDEYFPTRTEIGILRENLDEITERCGPECRLVEFGSGSSLKTHLLLDHLEAPSSYVPIEIAREHLLQASERLAERYPQLEILPVCADYTGEYHLPEGERDARRTVVFFPGSTIGNFVAHEAVEFLRTCRELCGSDGAVLLGVGLQTDPEVLRRAHNDREGVTAAFNLNLLHRARRELGAIVDPYAFDHQAVYDEEAGRVEMRLVSRREQEIGVDGHRFHMRIGEHILTEYSHKFTLEGFAKLAAHAGLRARSVWTDPQERFAVQLLEPLG